MVFGDLIRPAIYPNPRYNAGLVSYQLHGAEPSWKVTSHSASQEIPTI
jgi:hypothetical protein